MNMIAHSRRRRPDAGYTMLELLISSAVLALILGAAFMLVGTAQKRYSTANTRQWLEERSRIVLERMSEEVRRCSSGVNPNPTPTIAPAPDATGDQTITFRPSIGYTVALGVGSVTWGNPIIYDSRLMTGEVNDGIDNNGNGLVDEREIIWTGPINTRTWVGADHTVVLSQFLQEGSLRFTNVGTPWQTLRIDYTLERPDTGAPVAAGVIPRIRVPSTLTVQIRN